MKNLPKFTALALLVALTGALYSEAGFAAPNYEEIEKRKNAKTKLMGERVGKKVSKAFELYNEDKLDEAIAAFREIDPSDEFDKATVNRFLAQFYAQKENYEEAVKYTRLSVAPDVLNFNDQAQMMKLLGDLSRATEKYQDAINAYEAWMDFTGESDAKVYASIAQAYYELKQYRKVIEPADKAIALSEEPNKPYYMFKIGAYIELKQYKEAVKVQETVVKLFPEDSKAWIQLASFYMQVENFSSALTSLQVAYKRGDFERENHYKLLANLYSLVEAPWKAAVIQEKEIKAGNIERNKSTVTAIASYFHQSKHLADAAKYYEEAAKFDNDADLYRKAGNLLLQDQQYSAAVVRLNKALELGTDKKGSCYADLAEAYYYQDKFKLAYDAILKAQEDPSTRRFARSWASYIKQKAERRGVSL
ncbi:CDC27 family protein [Pseudoalteromonas sp. T1lg65]|uniref:CDC27 family protein n=1 Tax=Pseudoalteromonas sp. T1lg65 TaxID=2077101 RepID=UPI003F7B281D